MNLKITTFLFLLCCTLQAVAQSDTGLKVYRIFQEKCVACHSNADPQANLDLEGGGATESERAGEVYNNVFKAIPTNAHAAGKGYQQIYPGRPDKSFIFRKINDALEATIELDANEGGNMPPMGSPQLSEVEKELVRQWIFFGAPPQGEVVEEQLLYDFYHTNGAKSFPDGPPPAPAPDEGFQFKMGPFYLNPAGEPGNELEFFQKFALDLPEDVEVNRIDIRISNYSHHFILYNFSSPLEELDYVPDGFRLEPDHTDIGLMTAVQEATDLKLPEGTAFKWDKDIVFDLNSHYINYLAGQTYQAEAYVNVYTQPLGTAAQEMKSELFANLNIYIPNDENPHSAQQTIGTGLGGNDGNIYLWGLMGHTHRYGTGYKVWTRENGAQKDLIYDASCSQGVPDCVFNSFDYQHIPLRYFEPLTPIRTTINSGLIHEASWVNDGPEPVSFGPTSEDEMMVLILMYTEDTTGLIQTNTNETLALAGEAPLKVYPNPMQDHTVFELLPEWGAVDLQLFDVLGREVFAAYQITESNYRLERGNLDQGMYLYQVRDEQGRLRTGKLLLE